MAGRIEVCFLRLLLITMTWRPFRARRPGGRFPGLKPWAKILCPLRGNKLPEILLIFAPFNPGDCPQRDPALKEVREHT
jgi:hypothetical protein